MLHYKTIGEGSETVVILHGLFGCLDNWQTFAQKLGETYTIIIVDQRNHGKSPHFDEHNYELMSNDLKELVDFLDLTKFHLIGHSMGGKTAMRFAVEHPYLTEKLIVVDIGPKYYPPHHQKIIEALQAVDFSLVNSRKEVDVLLSEKIKDPGVKQFLLKGLTWESKTKMKWKFNFQAIASEIENIGEEIDSSSYFSSPTLFLKGENSSYIEDRDHDKIEQIFPNSEVIDIANSGHWVHAENPVDFHTEVISFLK